MVRSRYGNLRDDGVGGMAGRVLASDPLDQAAVTQLWLAGIAFIALTAAGLTTTFVLTKAGFGRWAGRH